jgi:hypothetical protein
MNAMLLVMTSAVVPGSDVIPAGWGEKALPQVVHSTGCDACNTTSPRATILDRLKSRFGMKSNCGCTSAPSSCCTSCGSVSQYYQPNLLDKLKSRWGSRKAVCCDPCAVGTSNGAHPSADIKPKEEPKPKEGGKSLAPTQQPQSITSLPILPQNGSLPSLPAANTTGQTTVGNQSPY